MRVWIAAAVLRSSFNHPTMDTVFGSSGVTHKGPIWFDKFSENAAGQKPRVGLGNIAANDSRLTDHVAGSPGNFEVTESESLLLGTGFGVAPLSKGTTDGNYRD